MIQSDAAFIIGRTHKVCQDYAVADNRTAAFRNVWLSDGCSSSPNTDIGARLLSHGMQQRLSSFGPVAAAAAAEKQQIILDALIRKTLRSAARSAAQMGVSSRSLDATLLGLVRIPGQVSNSDSVNPDSVMAVLYGDGAIVFGRRDGIREVYCSQYPAGYPYYPAYFMERDRLACWQEVSSNRHTITRTTLLPDGGVGETTTLFPDAPCHLLQRPAEGLRFAAVLSDGIESFESKFGAETCATFKSVDYLTVVAELTAFKNFKGEFVHRRLQSFEKECARRGWHHNDDISAAALYFEKE